MANTAVRASQIANVPVGNPAVNLPVILKVDNTEATFTNSAAENTLWTYSLPGGILGANDAIRFSDEISILNNSGGNQTYTLRWKYGGTTLLSVPILCVANASTFGTILHVLMKNAGATNSQKATGSAVAPNAQAGSTSAASYGTSAIDSTTAQSIVLTVQSSAATATQTVVQLLAVLEYLHTT